MHEGILVRHRRSGRMARGLCAPLIALGVAAPGALAAPLAGFAPMAFLAGHCWKGAFPGGEVTDEHCFAWLYGGMALRDTHTVRTPGKPDYVGETTYWWDSLAGRIEFVYIENAGGVSRGTLELHDGALVVAPTQYVEDGHAMTYRARWTRVGDDAYEAWSEAESGGAWKTMFRVTLARLP
jgi:hypothetical protein